MKISWILIFLSTSYSFQAFAQRTIAGEQVKLLVETGHPYRSLGSGKLAWKKEITVSHARYIALHFEKFELAKNDYVIIRSLSGKQSYRYSGRGKNSLSPANSASTGFWAPHIKGETAVVELYSVNSEPSFGVRIDRIVKGYPKIDFGDLDFILSDLLAPRNPAFESRCGIDDSKWAKCYKKTEPTIYATSRAIVRLLVDGYAYCTGWLVGSEGHVMTNHHCISNNFEARDTDFEVMAEGNSCEINCVSESCNGIIISSGGTIVKTDRELDYTLIKLDRNPSQEYGFMQLRAEVEIGERVYLPGHPDGWGKKIALESTHPQDVDGFGVVHSLTENQCANNPITRNIKEIGYYLDTQGTSSGSPLVGYTDNLVVGLHHCKGTIACTARGGSLNRAVPISLIIDDLGDLIPKDAVYERGLDAERGSDSARSTGLLVDTVNDPEVAALLN